MRRRRMVFRWLLAGLLACAAGPAAAFTSCLANHESGQAVDGQRFAYTWIRLPAAAPVDAGAHLRSVLVATGFSPANESRRGDLTSFTATSAAPELSGMRFRFDVDRAIGIVAVSATSPDEGRAWTRFESSVCALLGTAFPSGEELPGRPGLFGHRGQEAKAPQTMQEATRERFAQDLDWLYGRALQAGRALVVMPVPNIDGKYGLTALQKRPVEFWADLSSTSRWRRADGGTLRVGHRTDARYAGMPGSHHSFVADGARFLVFIVEPGRYELEGMSIELKQTMLPEVRPGDARAARAPGTAYFEPGKYEEYYREQEWRDAKYEDQEISTSYCSLVMVGGPCVQWSQHKETVQQMVRQAGYYEATKSYMADLLRVDARLDEPFATFEVAPGEAVLVDGLYAQHPSVGFDAGRCALEGRGVRCALTDFVMVRIPASLQALQSDGALKATARYPTLRGILGRAVARPVTVAAEGGALVPGLGQLYGIAK